MANPQMQSPQGTGATSRRTAQEVIEMFSALGLPVCDDDKAIADKVTSQRNRYLRDKNNPDAKVRARADRWFETVEALQNRRQELLKVVYGLFVDLSNTALSVAAASRQTTLTPQLKGNLLNLAFRQCSVDDKLADRFLKDYIQQRGLEEGKPLVRPAPVENFTAESGPGKISLKWSLPKGNYDEIEIVREMEPLAPGQEVSKESETVYSGTDTSYVDSGVVPGTWYTYRAHAIFQGFQGADNVSRAVCLAEVRKPSAVWKDESVNLTWELPAEGISVLIFRRTDAIPSVRSGTNGPEPADKFTKQVHRGAGSSWKDSSDLTEGTTYHYWIVADYGQDLFTKGVDVQVTVPKAPPAAPSLTASYKRSAGKDVVDLKWQPVPGGVPVDYIVVRREGNAPPARVGDGIPIQTTPQTGCLDEQVVAGCRYTYAVFTGAGEMYSRTGTAAPSVDILAEVTGLTAKVGDETVELEWSTPANVSDVVVRRSLSPPRDHTDGKLVNLTGVGHAKDEGLQNGKRYHYLVCCAYRPDGTNEIFSSGMRTSAVPEQLPDPVEGFKVHAQGTEALCTWTPPAHGQVVVLRSKSPHGFQFGDRLTADEVAALGERIVTTESGQAVDTHPDINKPHYSVFTIAGSHAVAGGTGACAVCPDVTDLRLSATKDGITLRWVWPEGCTAVRVARRTATWPEGPNDAEATCVPCMRIDYMAAGEKFVDKIQGGQARFYYVVYAQASGAPDLFFSAGTGPGCRAEIEWQPRWMTLRYRLSSPVKGPQKGKAIHLTWTVEDPLPDFAGFVLVAGQTKIPSYIEDGVELFRWTPKKGQTSGSHEAWIALEKIQQRRWARFFCKAMVLDSAQSHATLIIHPNTCISISDTGEMEIGEIDKTVRIYSPNVPKTVICPHCFDEFSVGRMLFTSFGSSGNPVPARYTWIDRLLRRPPQPPKNQQGQRLTRKVCPNPACNSGLPFTAGTQGSLVIGLIGAKFSGKSHYIASLIKRLQEQVGNDLQAALIPVSDETHERYQLEFHDPLFKDHFELPMTVGTPPPLIYDLTLDGKLWDEKRNRAVTLALYDTAGENFDREDTVQQMVKYLRVASGIIFLIDPLQAPAVREALPSTVRLPDVDRMAEPNVIISRVLQELENGKVVARSGRLSTPVAVVLAKCDVLRDAGLIEANRLWSTDKRHVGYFDIEAHNDMTGMMGEYVQRWSPAAYNTVRQRFSRHAFFGVSATGCASDKDTRRYKYISPWRVEDPLLWLLTELGVIPTR